MAIKTIIVLLIGLTLASVRLAEAQQAGRIYRIGFLYAGFPGLSPGMRLLQRELRALGYIEGKNIAFEYRFAENKIERLPALADELVRLKVDVLTTTQMSAALAAKNATKIVPIVFQTTGDPVAAGLVDSLARPGGNITGYSDIGTELAGKRLELLKETIPTLSRVAVLWNPENPTTAQSRETSQLVARELGLELHSMEIRTAEDIEGAFKEAIKARSTALMVTQLPITIYNQKQIVDLAAKKRLPGIYPREDFVENGGLMSYAPDGLETSKRLAAMIDKIFKGKKPADLPVEEPIKFEFIINLKAAKQIGLTVPANVLYRADKVIK
jgi:putative tryptophan/tyrosine transport system substrate-binding protein